jgi:hypothetical protein
MKIAGTGATLPSMPGAQRVLETSLIWYQMRNSMILCVITWDV